MDCPMCHDKLLFDGHVDITPLTERCDGKCPNPDCGLITLTIRRDAE